jgi:hypothetical protein
MRQTQKQIIIRYLQELNEWTPAYKLRGVGTPFGFIGHQGDRRCRELAAEGKVEHKIENGFSYYRSTLVRKVYTVLDSNGQPYKKILI